MLVHIHHGLISQRYKLLHLLKTDGESSPTGFIYTYVMQLNIPHRVQGNWIEQACPGFIECIMKYFILYFPGSPSYACEEEWKKEFYAGFSVSLKQGEKKFSCVIYMRYQWKWCRCNSDSNYILSWKILVPMLNLLCSVLELRALSSVVQ